MKYIKTFFLISCLFYSCISYSHEFFPGKYKLNIELGGGYSSSSGFFDKSSTQISQLFDSSKKMGYIYEYNIFSAGLSCRYKASKNSIVYITLPVSYYKLNEDFLRDTNQRSPTYRLNVIRGDFSTVVVPGYNIGLNYILDSGKITYYTDLMLNIPMKLTNGYQTQETQPIKIYQAFELTGSVGAYLSLGGGWLKATAGYNYRTGLFRDLMQLYLEGGFSSVENTDLRAFAEIRKSMNSFENSENFDLRKTPFQEDSYTLGLSFHIDFTDSFYSTVIYKLTLLGKNTYNLGTISLNAGAYF